MRFSSTLVLENVLNIWSSKITGRENLYEGEGRGQFISFNFKLLISQNLGLLKEFCDVFSLINKIRNKFSHKKLHYGKTDLDFLKNKVNSLVPEAEAAPCEKFSIFNINDKNVEGERDSLEFYWEANGSRIRFTIVFTNFMYSLDSRRHITS